MILDEDILPEDSRQLAARCGIHSCYSDSTVLGCCASHWIFIVHQQGAAGAGQGGFCYGPGWKGCLVTSLPQNSAQGCFRLQGRRETLCPQLSWALPPPPRNEGKQLSCPPWAELLG